MSAAVADKLAEARKLVEAGWCQEDYARGKSGRQVDPRSPYAVCFCSMGAIGRVNRHWPHSDLPGAREFARAIGGTYEGHILDFNDQEGRTQAEVLAAFDRAIELARKSA